MKALLLLAFWSVVALDAANSCLKCHEGIEAIREPDSKMMQAIDDVAEKAGYPKNGCIVCHGGNPNSVVKARAHQGTVGYFLNHAGPKGFYAAPGSTQVNRHTCGMCHGEQVDAQMNSLMATGQEQVHSVLWGFGAAKGYEQTVGAVEAANPGDRGKRVGTDAYRGYMEALAAREPQVFPETIGQIPDAPTVIDLERDPSLSARTYLHQVLKGRRLGAEGDARRGDYRGQGCSACHIPYANSGYYEGNDPAIDKTQPGHLLVHSIQATRDAKVKVHEVEYSGVPVGTCAACHNGGKQIGMSYQGLMVQESEGAFDEAGDTQPLLHAKRYRHLQADLHYAKGMLCQDCHTSVDLHGDGFLSGAGAGAVEVECQDCHGTTDKYPWELPLGYADEFAAAPKTGTPRGVAETVADYLKKGSVPEAPEGYLRSARGNPLVHAVKQGNRVLLHLASGKELTLLPLKTLKAEGKLSAEALTAMDRVRAHTDKLECYSCHSAWAPQIYGRHVRIDYSGDVPQRVQKAVRPEGEENLTGENAVARPLEGSVHETYDYLRWENPALGQNGEGRVSPVIPGAQFSLTVIGEEGTLLVSNLIPETADANGTVRPAATISPLQPHTVSKYARSCENCHTDPKAAGYGTEHGRLTRAAEHGMSADLTTTDGSVIPENSELQIPGMSSPRSGWERFVDENGTVLQTVGSHWRLSAPLSNAQRDRLDRSGVCLSCHNTIPEGDLGVSAMVHLRQMAGVELDNAAHTRMLESLLRIGAWGQVAGGGLAALIVLYLFFRMLFRKKRKGRRWR